MPTSTKENTLIFLALLITYFGVYLLAQSGTIGQKSDARWAGFFSVTLGVFALLTLLFGHANTGAVPAGTPGGAWSNVYLVTAGAALAASAYFNYKLVRDLGDGTLKWVVYANIAAHVALLFSYFMNFGTVETRLASLRGNFVPTPAYTPLVPQTPALGLGGSPRLPVRAR